MGFCVSPPRFLIQARIGGGDGTGGLGRARRITGARVEPSRGMEAEPETADSAVEQVLSAYKDCVRVLGRDPLAEVRSLMPACQQGV